MPGGRKAIPFKGGLGGGIHFRVSSTVLRKSVPKLDMERAVSEQIDKLEQVLAAAYALSEFSHVMQSA
jgi:hypothetical protein